MEGGVSGGKSEPGCKPKGGLSYISGRLWSYSGLSELSQVGPAQSVSGCGIRKQKHDFGLGISL